MRHINVEIWSDFSCPWCWIAKRRLDKAIKAVESEIEVSVTNKAYRLVRGMAPIDFREALHQKLGSKGSAQDMMDTIARNAAEEGLVYNFDSMRFGDTTDAHTIVKSAPSKEIAQRLIERIMYAGTTEGVDIFDRKVLQNIAAAEGMPNPFDSANLRSISASIAADEAQAGQVTNGVPLFVFGERTYLSGARPVELFIKALTQSAVERPQDLSESYGQSCDINGCKS